MDRRFPTTRALVLWLALSACSSTVPESRHDAAANGEGGVVCTETVAERCAKLRDGCITRWPDNPRIFCPVARSYEAAWVGQCGQYHVIRYMQVDISNFDYYDGITGELVAIVSHHYVGGEVFCTGPQRFVEPHCPGDQPGMDLVCKDGGAGDAG